MYTKVAPLPSGMPSWPKDAKPWGLIACHDTEGGTGKAGAQGTIDFLLSTAASRQASYHEIWAWEAGILTVYQIVPPTRAAGSINPVPYGEPNGAYDPDSWVKTCLGANAWDPNQVSYAVSIAGTVAYVNGLASVPAFVAAAKSRLLDLSAQLHVVHLAEHFRYQPHDRTDWGTALTPALGGLALQPPATLMGYRLNVPPSALGLTITFFRVVRFTHALFGAKPVVFAPRGSHATVLHGSPGFWRIAGGPLDGLYAVAGKSGPFTISAVYSDGTVRAVNPAS